MKPGLKSEMVHLRHNDSVFWLNSKTLIYLQCEGPHEFVLSIEIMSEDSPMSGVIYYMRHFSFPLSLTYEIMEMYTEV